MQDARLFDKWTLQGLLDELDVIELFEAPEHGRVLGEITEKQKELYNALGVELPRYKFWECRVTKETATIAIFCFGWKLILYFCCE